ncbi:MAG: thioredoxin family protein [Candidatus Eremiobacteraeota bacterium]|nr:thioredoxin family protein [Candidatus Eremiobacteraeota bacterium]
MNKILILGTGCPKCEKLYKLVTDVVSEEGLDAEVTKITDINAIIEYGVMMTPALVKDGKVLVAGKIPSKEDMKKMLK